MDAILLVEDDHMLGRALSSALGQEGWRVVHCKDVASAHTALVDHAFVAVLLDLGLPGGSGLEVLSSMRSRYDPTPVLIITARDQLSDRVRGLDVGADDYIVKPFALPELAARVSALIRRQRKEVTANTLQVADLQLDPARQEVRRDGQLLKLSPTAFRILRILMRESPKVVSREQLEHELWGDLVPDSDALRSHLYNLRKAVDKPFENALLNTLPGVGFSIQEDRPTAG